MPTPDSDSLHRYSGEASQASGKAKGLLYNLFLGRTDHRDGILIPLSMPIGIQGGAISTSFYACKKATEIGPDPHRFWNSWFGHCSSWSPWLPWPHPPWHGWR